MTYSYCIGADNRLAWVSEEWLQFARDNDAPALTREQVVGRSLFGFISGAETEYLYYLLLDEVRSRNTTVVVPFRCDGPGVRRFMNLKMSPLEKAGVGFEGHIVQEEARDNVSFLASSVTRSAEALTICSWCKRVQVGQEWLEVEAAVARLDLFGSRRMPQQNHGVCDPCGGHLRRVVDGAVG